MTDRKPRRAPRGPVPSDETETPPEFYAAQVRLWVDELGTEFDLDAAASHANALAPVYYTQDGLFRRAVEPVRISAEDGLSGAWGVHTSVWVNPPYSDIEPWVVKAWREMARADGPDVIVMLLPARTDAPWWREHVEPYRDRRIPFRDIRFDTYHHGRLAFLRGGQPIPATKDGVVLTRKRDGQPRRGSARFGVVTLVWRRELSAE